MSVPRVLALALGATALTVAVGVVVVGAPAQDDDAPTSAPSVPLTDFDTTDLTAERGAFCDRVPEEAVREALGAEPVAETSYGNGERTDLTAGVRDVAHEYGCTWSAEDGTVARAWVFAPPVTAETAATLVAAARKTRGCRVVPGAPAYGVPSLALQCERGGTRQQSYRGLFGDAWLTCELSAPAAVAAAALQERADRWCVTVASAAERRS
ncbi:hypothetical protein LRP67_07615 [Nocardioides sp. cx-169]|uniref:hypothetical protein n=1 Tax=Nocardioides sp. cx-169 TaxID=2899080 RepID=UPI001E2948CF|nr:hypothetical protein [Nocardioides sp. cx-169]MCD4533945.1 hypothetical protein [Nocardioides sp. cx-169]